MKKIKPALTVPVVNPKFNLGKAREGVRNDLVVTINEIADRYKKDFGINCTHVVRYPWVNLQTAKPSKFGFYQFLLALELTRVVASETHLVRVNEVTEACYAQYGTFQRRLKQFRLWIMDACPMADSRLSKTIQQEMRTRYNISSTDLYLYDPGEPSWFADDSPVKTLLDPRDPLVAQQWGHTERRRTFEDRRRENTKPRLPW